MKNTLTTLKTSLRCPPAPANIKMHIPVWTFHRRTDSSWSIIDVMSLTEKQGILWIVKIWRRHLLCLQISQAMALMF